MSQVAIKILNYDIRRNKATVSISKPFEESEDELDPNDEWKVREVSMIYTVGQKNVYDKLFEDVKYPKKKGVDIKESYAGGSVWRNYLDARESAIKSNPHREHPYDIYGVLADWKRDTIPDIKGNSWHNLLFDSFLVKLDKHKIGS
jgi:hypothetical protein